MEKISELITKKKLEEGNIIIIKKKKKNIELSNEIKDILILKNNHIILSYDKKLEFYKITLQKYLEIYPFSQESPIIINDIFEIETEMDFINLAITTNENEIYFCEIKNNSFNIMQKMQGNILCKLSDNKIIKFFHKNSNIHTYSIYKKGKHSKYEKTKDNEITFKSYFEKFTKKLFNQYNIPFSIINVLRTNLHDYDGIFDVDSYSLEMKKYTTDIKVIKLFKLSENKMIIITKEKNKHTWAYNTNEEVREISSWFEGYVNLYCKYFIYSILLFDIKTEEISILYSREILYLLHEPNHYVLETFIHSFDANIIGDNFIYFNICFHNKGWGYNFREEFKNEFVIYNINKKSFVEYNLAFKSLNELIMDKFNNILSYKMKTNFYLIFGLDLYEFIVTKNGIEKSLICSFDGNNTVKFFKFKKNTFYIITNNYFYIYKLKN